MALTSLAGPAGIALACFYGIVAGYNDGSSLFASVIATGTISLRTASLVLIAVPLGAAFLGVPVERTIGAALLPGGSPDAMGFCAIVGIAISVVVVSGAIGAPTSMTLALVGAMMGWGGLGAGGAWHAAFAVALSVIFGTIAAFFAYRLFRSIASWHPYKVAMKVARLQHATALFEAYAYGANDLGKTIGLITVAFALSNAAVPVYGQLGPLLLASLCFAVGIVFGWRRLGTRQNVFRMRPTQGLSQQFATGLVVTTLACIGAPVSTTQTIGASRVGVGLSAQAAAIRWRPVRLMGLSWVVTLPTALALSAVVHALLRMVSSAR